MNLKERMETFTVLGKVLKNVGEGKEWSNYENGITREEHDKLDQLVRTVHQHNGWFIEEMVRKSFLAIGETLNKQTLEEWIGRYEIPLLPKNTPKRIAVIMAGNIPMVGFHDFLCVLLSGNIFVGKCSSKDNELLRAIAGTLQNINPYYKDKIFFVDGKIEQMDAVIATGSNNSNRYFEYYFSSYPSILRKNRNAVAILTGNESEEELTALGNDLLDYFGLGCRNVSKLYLPKGYDLNKIIKNIFFKQTVLNNNKYGNNYDYQKSIYLMSQVELLENGFLLFKEDEGLSSPIATVFYQYYEDRDFLDRLLFEEKENIQCIVSKTDIPFGQAQKPNLWDYADNIDTMEFLLKLK